jgi:hypothetical protein
VVDQSRQDKPHISKQSPLERKPMMVILEDKKDHIKQASSTI